MAIFRGKKSRRRERLDGLDSDLSSQLRMLDSKADAQDITALKETVESLALISRALWSFVQEQQNITEADLVERMEQIKQRKPTGETCLQCGRIMSLHHNKCLYCGAQGQTGSVFDRLKIHR